VTEVSRGMADDWISRFGDPAALARRLRWDGLTAEDFQALPARHMRDLGNAARRAEATLRAYDAAAAKATLLALERGQAEQAPLGLLLADADDWTALRSLLREAAGTGWHGVVQASLGRVALAHGITALREAKARMKRDAKLLAERFGFRADALRDVAALGDPHAGGRRVLRLEDANGQVVFLKPRPLDGERLMDKLACSLGPDGAGIRLPKMLVRPTYGWVAEARPADSPALRAAGTLLAIADLAGAVDLHAENLMPVAAGAALLDGEMALHPDLPLDLVPVEARAAAAALRSGVLRTGILPEPHQPPSLCGVAAWGTSVPMMSGDAAEVAEGYTWAFTRLCARAGARASLARCLPARGTVRLLLRHTAGYARLLDRLRDPRATPGPQALALHLEMLRIVMARHARRRPRLWGVAAAEATALLRGDIPRLWVGWDSDEIREGSGRAAPCAVLATTPRAMAMARTALFGPGRATVQARLVRKVLSAG
jgi:hypothetical protein